MTKAFVYLMAACVISWSTKIPGFRESAKNSAMAVALLLVVMGLAKWATAKEWF